MITEEILDTIAGRKRFAEKMVMPIAPEPMREMIRAKHSGCLVVTEERRLSSVGRARD